MACKGQLLDKVEKKEQAPKAPKVDQKLSDPFHVRQLCVATQQELKEQPAQAVASSSCVPEIPADSLKVGSCGSGSLKSLCW